MIENNKPALKNASVKIMIASHKPSELLKSDVFTPIHVGRGIAKKVGKDSASTQDDLEWMLANMPGDDAGDNISGLNRKFCELTAIYWAWKNFEALGNPDYVGLMHYRRHFSFSENHELKKNEWGVIPEVALDDEYIARHGMCDNKVKEAITGYDIILPEAHHFSPYQHFKENHDSKDYDSMMDILLEKYPDYKIAAEQYNSGNKSYFFNMFIMKKEMFFIYCEWLFSIVFELDERIDYKNSNVNELRLVGFLSERLLGIFITYQKLINSELKVKELSPTHIENTERKKLGPYFNNNNIPIVLAADNNYACYLGVAVQSIISHASDNFNYDLIVMDDEISQENKRKYEEIIGNKSNVKIRYIDVSFLKKKYSFEGGDHVSIATYYRLFIPGFLPSYEKIIYLDCDMVILDDMANLYNINIGDNYIAAVFDYEVHRLCRNDKTFDDYFKNKLKLNESHHYFNAGVLLINNKKWVEKEFEKQCLEKLFEGKRPWFFDQCVLNVLCDGHTQYLDAEWNVEWHLPLVDKQYAQHMAGEVYQNYEASRKNPKIIHYCSIFKPWLSPHLPLSAYWWTYARKTPFYEEIIYKSTTTSTSNYYYAASTENSNKKEMFYFLNIPIFKIKRSPNAIRYYFMGARFFKKKIDATKIKYYFFFIPFYKIKMSDKYFKYYILGLRLFKKKYIR